MAAKDPWCPKEARNQAVQDSMGNLFRKSNNNNE
jgi:hypothetical protein